LSFKRNRIPRTRNRCVIRTVQIPTLSCRGARLGWRCCSEMRRHRHGGKVLDMSDLNWISTANPHHSASGLSKSRTDFGVEPSSRSTHLGRAVNATVKPYTMSLQTTLRPTRAATQPSRRNSVVQRVMGLLRRWRERAHSRRRLYELDDHILRDIGLTRDALLREATRPFWR
jgi:uncharacterized protein YjiS (DUF1127 family)